MVNTLSFITGHPLTRDRPLSAIGRFVRWQVESRLKHEVLFDWIEGARLAVRHGMTGATGNIYCGLHEFADMSFLLHLLRPSDLFLDVGANIGSYTVLASKVCGARTMAFEPDPGSAQSLRRNIALNDLQDVAQVCQFALGATNAEASFTLGLDTMNHVVSAPTEETRTVAVRRLEEVSGASAPTLIKLDVEGYEEEVLQGAAATLGAPSLLAVQSELQSAGVENVLAGAGFKRAYYDPFSRTLSDTPGARAAANALFVRRTEEVLKRVGSAAMREVLRVRL